jgi:hypothetical protein
MDFTIYAIGINLLRVVVLASKHKFLKAVFFAYILNISKISDIWSSCKVYVSIVRRHLHQQRALRLEVVQWLKNIVIESSWKNIIL